MIADLARLGWTFLWLSIICVGGGLGVVPEMQRQVVDRFHWLSAREFLDGYALSQLTPGPTMLVVVFVGYGAHGVIGSLVALAAMFLPVSVFAAFQPMPMFCGRPGPLTDADPCRNPPSVSPFAVVNVS